jgi:uncharacterized protein with NRDE domain
MFQVVPDAPLIIAANRDERLDRPAAPMTVLRERGPRILGGQDLLAGGTWLAVNEHGLVAGLTNQPSADGRDPSKRSRGELPLAFAAHRSAREAVTAVSEELDPAAYNPCWMLVGDRDALYSIGVSGSAKPEIERLGPGLHVLENAPLRAASAKAKLVRTLVTNALADPREEHDAAATIAALITVLGDHRPAVPEPRTDATGRVWPASLSAACVHADGYGTRSAMIVRVPVLAASPAGCDSTQARTDASVPSVPCAGAPAVLVADGRPCEAPMQDATALWMAAASR